MERLLKKWVYPFTGVEKTLGQATPDLVISGPWNLHC
jgi:hypothetical protein